MTATTDHDAMLAAILANPADDSPRLQLADWLDEHEQPERAEFIRVQVELANLREPSIKEAIRRVGSAAGAVAYQTNALMAFVQQRDALRRREGLLWIGHRQEWFLRDDSPFDAVQLIPQAIPDAPVVGIVRRGFVDEVRAPLASILGGECRRCEGEGDLGHAWERPGFDTCPDCKGSRTLPGILRPLLAACPVTAVRASDKEPWLPPYDDAKGQWYRAGSGDGQVHPQSDLPDEVYDLLPTDLGKDRRMSVYQSREAAAAALSAALLAHARSIPTR